MSQIIVKTNIHKILKIVDKNVLKEKVKNKTWLDVYGKPILTNAQSSLYKIEFSYNMKANPTPDKVNNYKGYRNKLTEIYKTAEEQYFQVKLNKNKFDSMPLCRTIKETNTA